MHQHQGATSGYGYADSWAAPHANSRSLTRSLASVGEPEPGSCRLSWRLAVHVPSRPCKRMVLPTGLLTYDLIDRVDPAGKRQSRVRDAGRTRASKPHPRGPTFLVFDAPGGRDTKPAITALASTRNASAKASEICVKAALEAVNITASWASEAESPHSTRCTNATPPCCATRRSAQPSDALVSNSAPYVSASAVR